MDSANEVRCLWVVQLETELALGVRFGVSRFFHSLAQLKHNDFVSSGWLASGGVFHRASESLGNRERGQQKNDECDTNAYAVLIA
jgi:hypothetical protein